MNRREAIQAAALAATAVIVAARGAAAAGEHDTGSSIAARARQPLRFDADAARMGLFGLEATEADGSDVILAGMLGQAGPGAAAEVEAGSQWDVYLNLYLWLPILIEGSAAAGPANISLDLTIGDVFDTFRPIGVLGRAEAWYDDTWGIIFDGMYARLESRDLTTSSPPFADVNLTIQQAMIDVAGSLKVFDVPVGEDSTQRLRGDLIAGVRWQFMDQQVDATILPLPSISLGENWFEPLVGGRLSWRLNDKWIVLVRGDASGFGVGNGSDLTWTLTLGAGWQINPNFAMQFAYRFMSIDYENGATGAQRMGLDIDLHGPWIGFVWKF